MEYQVRLVAYQRSDDLDLVDAVFAEGDGPFWHFQKIDAHDDGRAERRPRVHFSELETFPELGTVAETYQTWALPGRPELVVDGFWFELMLAAFKYPKGAPAIVRVAF